MSRKHDNKYNYYIVTGSRYADCHCYPTVGYIVTATQRLNENLLTDFISVVTNATNPSLYRQRLDEETFPK
jgi:hypothetical protein